MNQCKGPDKGLNAFERQNLHDRSRRSGTRQRQKLSVEGIDRMYLNVFVPACKTNRGLSGFFVSIAAGRCRR